MKALLKRIKRAGLVTFASIALFGGTLFAQDAETRIAPKTLLGGKNFTYSGFGGPVVKFTQMNGALNVLVGSKGGVLINDRFVLGGTGFGLVYPLKTSAVDGLGYGGMLIEYYFFPKELFNISIGLMAGAGGAGKNEEGSSFFIAEPELSAYVMITEFMRFGVGASYRYSNGLDLDTFTDEDFRRFSGSAIFEFGWF